MSDPAYRYLLLKPDSDNPVTFLDPDDLAELLANPIEYADVRHFLTFEQIAAKPSHYQGDPNYWNEGEALLLKIEVVAPEPVTTAWRLP